jgi:hypothetical protein
MKTGKIMNSELRIVNCEVSGATSKFKIHYSQFIIQLGET